jgi:hypothetical protein
MGHRSMILNLRFFPVLVKSHDSSVGIALGYGLDDRGSRVRLPAGAGYFSLHHRIQNGSGAHPASYPMGTRGFSLGVKRPERKADHSPPSSAEVKNAWSYTSTPQYVFMAWCLVKQRDNFTFTFRSWLALTNKIRGIRSGITNGEETLRDTRHYGGLHQSSSDRIPVLNGSARDMVSEGLGNPVMRESGYVWVETLIRGWTRRL